MVFGGGTGIDAVGPKIWIWPMLCCFLTMAFVYFYCPEVWILHVAYAYSVLIFGQTTGKTLEEIDYLFAKPAAAERMDREGRSPVRQASGGSTDEEKVDMKHVS